MSAYADQEEVEKLRAWWKNYGAALLIGVALGIAILFGNKYWDEYKEQQRVAASELYSQVLQQAQTPSDRQTAVTNANKLITDYAGTPYAGMAALMLARFSFEANDVAGTKRHLEWAIDEATDPAVVHVARLRLGRLHIASGEHDAALALTTHSAPGFEADYLELKGDALLAQGKQEEARNAYSDALKQLGRDAASSRRMLEMKLADLGGSPRK